MRILLRFCQAESFGGMSVVRAKVKWTSCLLRNHYRKYGLGFKH